MHGFEIRAFPNITRISEHPVGTTLFSEISVASFQQNGTYSPNTFMRHVYQGWSEVTYNYTLCLWMRLNYLRSSHSSIVSLADDQGNEDMKLFLIYDEDYSTKDLQFRLMFCKKSLRKLRENCVETTLNQGQLWFQTWKHVCASVAKMTSSWFHFALYLSNQLTAESKDCFKLL